MYIINNSTNNIKYLFNKKKKEKFINIKFCTHFVDTYENNKQYPKY